MRSAEKSLFSGESVLIPRKGSLNNVMYVNEAFWTVDTMFFTVPRIPGAAKFLYQYVKRLDLASMNSGSAVPSMTTSILNALSLPIPPRDSLLSFNAKLQSMYDAVRANNLENRRLESLRDSLLPKLMSGEIDVSKIDLMQLNSHLPKQWCVLLQIQGHPYIPATTATAVTQACVGTMKVWYFLEFGTTSGPPGGPSNKKGHRLKAMTWCYWSRGQDLNLRPPGYEPGELPDCSTPHHATRFSEVVSASEKLQERTIRAVSRMCK